MINKRELLIKEVYQLRRTIQNYRIVVVNKLILKRMVFVIVSLILISISIYSILSKDDLFFFNNNEIIIIGMSFIMLITSLNVVRLINGKLCFPETKNMEIFELKKEIRSLKKLQSIYFVRGTKQIKHTLNEFYYANIFIIIGILTMNKQTDYLSKFLLDSKLTLINSIFISIIIFYLFALLGILFGTTLSPYKYNKKQFVLKFIIQNIIEDRLNCSRLNPNK